MMVVSTYNAHWHLVLKFQRVYFLENRISSNPGWKPECHALDLGLLAGERKSFYADNFNILVDSLIEPDQQ